MAKNGADLDWTFEDRPDDSQAARRGQAARQRPPAMPGAPRDSRLPAPRPPEPRRPSALRRHWRWLMPLGALALLVGLVAYGAYWFGWQRVRDSLAQQIIYEDAQSTAGKVEAVLAIQAAGDKAWLTWRGPARVLSRTLAY